MPTTPEEPIVKEPMCPCGRPLHYSDPRVRELVEREIEKSGACLAVRFPAGIRERIFLVPRHFLALHGTNLDDVVRMGFEERKL